MFQSTFISFLPFLIFSSLHFSSSLLPVPLAPEGQAEASLSGAHFTSGCACGGAGPAADHAEKPPLKPLPSPGADKTSNKNGNSPSPCPAGQQLAALCLSSDLPGLLQLSSHAPHSVRWTAAFMVTSWRRGVHRITEW